MLKLQNINHRIKTRKLCSIISFGFFICVILSFEFYKSNGSIKSSELFLVARKSSHDAQRYEEESYTPQFSGNLSKLIVTSRYPNPGDPDCRNLSINLFRKDTFGLVGLVSYPGSGNTWLRHLIELSTGIFTGSVYFDEDLLAKGNLPYFLRLRFLDIALRAGFLGEKEAWDSGSTVVQKLHLKYSPLYSFPRTILLVREPYPAIISFVNFKEAGHLGSAQKSTLHHKKWPAYVLGQTFNWMSLIISWLQSPSQLHIVHYEKLLVDPKNELKKICRFLNVGCNNVHTTCFQKNIDGHFHRKIKTPPAMLEEPVLNKILAGENYISNLLVQHGHEPLPVELYQYHREVTKAR